MISRRMFLRGSGIAMSLPFLEATSPRAWAARSDVPRRMVAIETNLGILPQNFFPDKPGRDYALTPYLEILKEHRNEFTVFSGASHPQVDGGHQAEKTFLTAAPHPGSGGFRNSISLDQYAAERLENETRFPSMTLVVGTERNRSLSYTRNGVMIPAEWSAAAVYRRLFVQGTPEEVERRIEELRLGRSLLDSVSDRARALAGELGAADRERLEQYQSSVRELEERLRAAEAWEQKPKPKVTSGIPKDVENRNDLVIHTRLIYGMIRLALETDSTRIVTLFVNPVSMVPLVEGVSHETHSLTHHGNRPETLAELRLIEEAQFRELGGLFDSLKAVREREATLLDRTMVLYGTCMGNANAHSNTNLPILLAGGGFRHGQHLAFDTKKNYPLPNLFVSMLQRLGVQTDRFASSSGTMRGLEMS